MKKTTGQMIITQKMKIMNNKKAKELRHFTSMYFADSGLTEREYYKHLKKDYKRNQITKRMINKFLREL